MQNRSWVVLAASFFLLVTGGCTSFNAPPNRTNLTPDYYP